jgi:lipopolysaccharide/colanic/teichoic acid biosynthesis glycosyltransferase
MDTLDPTLQMSRALKVQKRLFDVVVAIVGLLLTWWIILLAALVSWLDTGEPGLFAQNRVGRYGKPFKLYKIRTMTSSTEPQSTVTTIDDKRITRSGRMFRGTKIDELPQLYNVLLGQMSLVGPRPDVAGFADMLKGEDRAILLLRPGITGPATLRYRDEETLLAAVDDAEAYNRNVIFPHKVQINLDYIRNYSVIGDIKYMLKTVFG